MIYIAIAAVVVLQIIILWRQHSMSEQLTAFEQAQADAMLNIAKEVSEMNSLVDSAITTLQSLAQKLREVAFDPAQVNALAAALDSKAGLLASAIIASTSPFSEAAAGVPRATEDIPTPETPAPEEVPPASVEEPVIEPPAEADAEVAAEVESLGGQGDETTAG